MGLLEAVKWITGNIDQFVNGMDNQGWTPYRMINWRRYNNMAWAKATNNKPDNDSERVFQSFMKLVQKIVDDHYDVDQNFKRHRVLVPQPGSRSLDIVEESSLLPVSEAVSKPSHIEGLPIVDEDTEGEEKWEDAAETWEHGSQAEGYIQSEGLASCGSGFTGIDDSSRISARQLHTPLHC